MNKSKTESLCKGIIVSDDLYEESRQNLETMGIRVYSGFVCKNVLPPLRKHVDMQLVMIEDGIYVCAPDCYEYYKEILCSYDCVIIKGNTELSSNYPYDIAYNITVVERYAVHNFKYTDSLLKNMLKNKTMINVSQGYAGCSVCALNSNSFITGDEGVYNELLKANINALLISSKEIKLPGFDHGFIGGATFMLSDNVLAINGNINLHPDGDRIKAYCQNQGVELVCLSKQQIMDIGSAVIIR